MENSYCLCGSFATHRCFECKPPAYLCLDCVEAHLSERPEDGLISLKTLKNDQDFSVICSNCLTPGPELLQVSENYAKPICKKCKKCKKKQKNEDFNDFVVSVKWKEIISNIDDLKEIGFRRHVAKLAYEEVESLNNWVDESFLDGLKETIIQAVSRMIQKKKDEVKKVKNDENHEVLKMKKEIDLQVLKKCPDVDSEAGKIVSFFMRNQGGRGGRKKTFVPGSDLLDCVEKLIERVLFNTNTIEHLIYFPNPGRPSILRINLEKMEKKDLIFERNWPFEASWCELSNKQILICGGNGSSSSEVLLINPTTLTVLKKHSFSGRSGHALIEINNFVYTFGGNRGKIVERFSLQLNEWEPLADLPYQISRAAACLVKDQVVLTGNDCLSLFGYSLHLNSYSDLGNSLEAFRTKNKILFYHEGKIFCITGNKVLFCDEERFGNWMHVDVVDKDWWTYCKPVVYRNCAFFIKFFVRNLWKLDLKTLRIMEIQYCDMVDVN